MTNVQTEFQAFVDEQPSYRQPVLRMFLSVDLVNSTAFKQKVQSGSAIGRKGRDRYSPWLNEIASFYREFPVTFNNEWAIVYELVKGLNGFSKLPQPRLWKANGDELIYVVELSSSSQPRIVFAAWLKSLRAYRTKLHDSLTGLDLKSACWVAGFPLSNTEILFREMAEVDVQQEANAIVYQSNLNKEYYVNNNTNGILRDYVGPSIDTGFRLGGLATPRKLILSLELAWLVAGSKFPSHVSRKESDSDTSWQNPKIYYDGRIGLKGVLAGVPYPIFWIDGDLEKFKALNDLEDELSNRKQVSKDQIETFCETFVNEQPTVLSRPFVLGDDSFGVPLRQEYFQDYRDFIEVLDSQMDVEIASENELAAPNVSEKADVTPPKQVIGDFLKKKLKVSSKKKQR